MKKLFRKTMTVLGSVALLGATMSGALAASYPTPFSATNTAVVVGASAAASDTTAAVSIATNLGMKAASSSAATVVGGDSVDLGEVFGDIVLNDDIGETLYGDELSLLEDGTVDSVEYTQKLELGGHNVEFDELGDEDNYVINSDLAKDERPVLHIDQTSGKLWTYTLTFNEDFDATEADNEKIVIAGKEFTIAPDLAATDEDLVLYASSNTVEVTYGQTQTVEVAGKSFTIAVTGGRDLDEPEATVSINGVSSRVEAGETIESDGEEFYVSEIFMNTFGDASTMSVEIFVGAEKLVLTSTNDNVEVSGDSIDSVTGYYTETSNLTNLQTIVLEFTPSEAEDDFDAIRDEYNYLEMGEAITDPVLGTFSIFFESASQDFTEDKEVVEIARSGSDLEVSFTNLAGDEISQAILVEDTDAESPILGLRTANDFEALDEDNEKDLLILQKEGSAGNLTYIAEIKDVEMESTEVKSVTFAYGGTTEKVAVGEAIRRSADTLYVCYVDHGGDNQDKSKFSIQYTSCADEDNADYYDGSLVLYAANDVEVDLSDLGGVVAGTESITFTEGESDDDNTFVFDITYSADEEYSIVKGALGFDESGTEDSEGEYGYYLTDFGSYIETEADEDSWVKVYTPEEEVTYNVFVATDVSSETPSETGKLTVLDSESSAYAGKNLIVVGGSAVNSVAASLLGLTGDARFGEGFTAKTSIVSGEALIEAFDHDGKVALLIAGYDAADTTKAASYLTSGATVSTDLGTKLRVTSQTEAVAITA